MLNLESKSVTQPTLWLHRAVPYVKLTPTWETKAQPQCAEGRLPKSTPARQIQQGFKDWLESLTPERITVLEWLWARNDPWFSLILSKLTNVLAQRTRQDIQCGNLGWRVNETTQDISLWVKLQIEGKLSSTLPRWASCLTLQVPKLMSKYHRPCHPINLAHFTSEETQAMVNHWGIVREHGLAPALPASL